MPSCTLHELHEPQSPTPTITRSQVLASSSMASGEAGFEADGLRWRTMSVNPYWALRIAATESNILPALNLLLWSSPTRFPRRLGKRGAIDDSATVASLTGLMRTNFGKLSVGMFYSPLRERHAMGQVTAVDDTFGPQLGITALIAPSPPPAATISKSSGPSTTETYVCSSPGSTSPDKPP